MSIATCAICGKKKELCQSARIDGIKQPRVCKECLLNEMRTGEWNINNNFWFNQMSEMNDYESFHAMKKKSLDTINDL